MLTILYYVDWRGGFVDNLVLDGGEGLLTIIVLRRPEGRVC